LPSKQIFLAVPGVTLLYGGPFFGYRPGRAPRCSCCTWLAWPHENLLTQLRY
jgi:hypothetical protein